jgi:hypothetical protein
MSEFSRARDLLDQIQKGLFLNGDALIRGQNGTLLEPIDKAQVRQNLDLLGQTLASLLSESNNVTVVFFTGVVLKVLDHTYIKIMCCADFQ